MSRLVAGWPTGEDGERRKAHRVVEKSRPCCWDSRRAMVGLKNGRDMSVYVQGSLSSRDGKKKLGLSIISFHDPSDGRGLVSRSGRGVIGQLWRRVAAEY